MGGERWATGNCAKNRNLTMRTVNAPSGIHSREWKTYIFWSFEIEKKDFIFVGRPDQTLANKKRENLPYSGPLSKNERVRNHRKVTRPCQRTKETVEEDNDGDINCN